MTPSPIVQELCDSGLAAGSDDIELTSKGREWLRALEDLESEEIARGGEAAADLILSTSALVR
jgi:hypothetical protein